MSIRINKITKGKFGNKLLQYNSLCQLGKNHHIDVSCINFDDGKFFENIIRKKNIDNSKKTKILFCKDIIDNTKLDFKTYNYILDDPSYCLHNVFFNVTKIQPRFFLKLKEEYKVRLDNNNLYIGVHFRGGDKHTINSGREIHKIEYYKDAINHVLNLIKSKNENIFSNKGKEYIFYLCTDDVNFKSYKQTIEFLKSNKINYKLGPATQDPNKHYIHDWAILSECDILINNSSTFCVTAGFLGKKNKYIIHSKKWLDKNINDEPWNKNGDKLFIHNEITSKITMKQFWQTFNNFWKSIIKKNPYYHCSKLI